MYNFLDLLEMFKVAFGTVSFYFLFFLWAEMICMYAALLHQTTQFINYAWKGMHEWTIPWIEEW